MIGYLFTDIDSSVSKWERTPTGMRQALTRHDALIDAIVTQHGGIIQDRAGDGVFAIFGGGNPIACAIEIQTAFAGESWDDVGGLSVRIGVHASPAPADEAVDRVAINRAARFAATAWGGQIVVSAFAAAVYATPEGASLVDLGNIHLRGIDQPQRVFCVSAGNGGDEFPPLRNVLRQTPRVPSQISPIYGREHELAELRGMLKSARLITILGAGGLGKTRLALEVASAISAEREVHIVTLSRADHDSAALMSAIIEMMRLPRRPARSDLETLLDYFAERDALLVLDNADAVRDDCDALMALLNAAPLLSVLITRREPFGWIGENVYVLKGLGVDGEGGFASSGAAMLFAQAARTVKPDFAWRDEEATAFKSINAAVGGAPLGLYLTAQWVGVLPLADIAARLSTGLELLSETSGGHKNGLREAFEVSWRLLDPALQSALVRIAAFPGSFDEAAATVVAGVEIAALRTLERKSLVERRGPGRFALHPLVQELANEKLAAEPESRERTCAAHSDYYLQRTRDDFQLALGSDQPRIAERLRADHLNILAAWTHAAANEQTRLTIADAECTFYLYIFAGMFSEAHSVFHTTPRNERLRLAFAALRANCLVHLSRLEEGGRVAAQILSESGLDAGTRGHAQQALGNCAHTFGRYAEAERHYLVAMTLRADDPLGRFYCRMSMAWAALHQDDFRETHVLLKDCEALCEAAHFMGGLLHLRLCAGELAAREGRFDDALTWYGAAMALEALVDNSQVHALLHMLLGDLYVKLGQLDHAQVRLTSAFETAGANERLAVRALSRLARVPGAEPDSARAYSLEALRRAAERLDGTPDLAQALIGLAILEAGDGARREAAELVAIAKAKNIRISSADEADLEAMGVDMTLEFSPVVADAALAGLLRTERRLKH
ncbi:MAG: hypothetical protein NT015_01145 [Alphaproteobacteria bacterium]|nr:hypothetical protein [Alphaproteobacteria bacterium]